MHRYQALIADKECSPEACCMEQGLAFHMVIDLALKKMRSCLLRTEGVNYLLVRDESERLWYSYMALG
jgi:hypothetical protein